MTRTILTITCGAVLLAGMALAAPPTPQNICDWTRALAWKRYSGCVDGVVARRYKINNAQGFDQLSLFAKCRHRYFKQWPGFQLKASLAGSTCIGPRYLDNGDQTFKDNLTGLVWEKKTNLDLVANLGDPHDADNVYTWSTGAPYAENGTAFTDFLTNLNTGFGSATGWRLPTLAELQTTVMDFACTGVSDGPRCTCPSTPCVDSAFTPSEYHGCWSATPFTPFTNIAWFVAPFGAGSVSDDDQISSHHVRAVRGGF